MCVCGGDVIRRDDGQLAWIFRGLQIMVMLGSPIANSALAKPTCYLHHDPNIY
jgi:hypothetical protein